MSSVPDPDHVKPWYLRNITEALALDEPSGNVYVRTGFQGNIIISGNVSIPGVVTVDSAPENPVHTHVSEIGTSGILNVPYMPIDGNVKVTSGNISVSGNVNANITGGNVSVTGSVVANISGQSVIANVTQGTTPWSVTGNVNANIAGATVATTFPAVAVDAFSRLRVSEPVTLFDSALNGERRNDFSTATTGTASVSFDYNANVRKLNVNTASGDQVIRESMYCFSYQPGKSLLTMNSFCMNAAKANLRQRVGYFTTANGIYFEQTGTTLNMVIRSSSSGSLVEERIPQSDWNGNKLLTTLDTTATQIFWCDIEWLGVGSVRCGFVINGQFIVCHTFHHANDPTFTTTYMGTATLPVRCEITNLGSTGSASTFQQICSTVISEGGYTASYFTYTAGTGIHVKRLTTAETYYPIASIRLNSGFLNSIVKLSQIDILSPTVNYYRWAIVKNATLTGATWASASSTTRVDVDTAATAVSGGTEIQSGFISSRELASLEENLYGQLGRTLAGVSDTMTLVISATSNNADVLAQIGWKEIL